MNLREKASRTFYLYYIGREERSRFMIRFELGLQFVPNYFTVWAESCDNSC